MTSEAELLAGRARELAEKLRRGCLYMDSQDGTDGWEVDHERTSALMIEAAEAITVLNTRVSPPLDSGGVESLAYSVANAKLGEGPAVRCEGPTPFEIDVAREWVRRVLRAQASSPSPDTGLLSECYAAMRDAMGVIDADRGPGRKHSNILNALAAARVKIEQRCAALTSQEPGT